MRKRTLPAVGALLGLVLSALGADGAVPPRPGAHPAAVPGAVPGAMGVHEAPPCGETDDSSDRNAPKSITSTVLDSFEACFSGGRLSLARQGGSALMAMECPFDMDGADSPAVMIRQEVPAFLLDELERLVRGNGVASINGWSRRNSALGCSFSLSIQYASGESIHAMGEGGAAVLPGRGWIPRKFAAFFFDAARRCGVDMEQAHDAWVAAHPDIPSGRSEFFKQCLKAVVTAADTRLTARAAQDAEAVSRPARGAEFIVLGKRLRAVDGSTWHAVACVPRGDAAGNKSFANAGALRFLPADDVALSPLSDAEVLDVSGMRFRVVPMPEGPVLSFQTGRRVRVADCRHPDDLNGRSSWAVRTLMENRTYLILGAAEPRTGRAFPYAVIWEAEGRNEARCCGVIGLEEFAGLDFTEGRGDVLAWIEDQMKRAAVQERQAR